MCFLTTPLYEHPYNGINRWYNQYFQKKKGGEKMECITVYNELGEEVKIVISDYIYQVLAEDEE